MSFPGSEMDLTPFENERFKLLRTSKLFAVLCPSLSIKKDSFRPVSRPVSVDDSGNSRRKSARRGFPRCIYPWYQNDSVIISTLKKLRSDS